MKKNWTQTKTAAFDRDNAIKMNTIARTVFAPIYPVIAKNAIAASGITRKRCVDLGSGPAMLAIAMAQTAPEMDVLAFDFSEDSRAIAMDNIARAGLENRITTAAGDVHAMPFEDNYADLIVSRGSMFFWKDLSAAFGEIYRILAPGGATYIGGGFGSLELRDQVIRDMAKVNPEWDCYAKKKTDDGSHARFQEMFASLGCHKYQIIDDDTGFWILLFKPA
jgi:ubiquinone/menaquinone biosynthesis C-methylase UbiE